MRATTLRICSRCGAANPRPAAACGACGERPLTTTEAPLAPAFGCVRVVASMRCRSCGQASPLDTVEADGTVRCTGCGLVQAYHVPLWAELFERAHGLADLATPGRDGLLGPHGGLVQPVEPAHDPFASTRSGLPQAGVSHADVVTVDGVVRTASLLASLHVGHPTCDRCARPLDLVPTAEGVESRCAPCGESRRYGTPDGAARLPHAPRAVLSDDTRLDATSVRGEPNAAGVVALACPACGAGLEVATGDTIVTCGYCRAACRIPSRTFHARAPGIVPPRPFWLVVTGPSAMRAEALGRARAARTALESSGTIEPLVTSVELTEAVRLARYGLALLVLAVAALPFAPALVERLAAVFAR